MTFSGAPLFCPGPAYIKTHFTRTLSILFLDRALSELHEHYKSRTAYASRR